MAPEKPKLDVPLWELWAALLPDRDALAEWHTPREIAALVGLRPRVVLKHLRDLFPAHEGQWRLMRLQVEALLKRIATVGKKLPSRASVEAQLQARSK